MSEMSNNFNSSSAQAEQPDAPLGVELKAGYLTYENYLIRVQEIYNRTKEDFFTLRLDDAHLLDAAE